jgi:hypothetical protein
MAAWRRFSPDQTGGDLPVRLLETREKGRNFRTRTGSHRHTTAKIPSPQPNPRDEMSCVTWAVLAVPHFCVRDEESGLLILAVPFALIDTLVERLIARGQLLFVHLKDFGTSEVASASDEGVLDS